MTEKPSNSIDEPPAPPPSGADQPDVGQAEAAPSLVAASDPDRPAEPVGESNGSIPAAEPAETVPQPPDPTVAEPLQPAPAATPVPETAPPEDPSAEAGQGAETEQTNPSEQTAEVERIEPVEPTEPAAESREPDREELLKPLEEEPKSDNMDWYILKVQSNREDSIREGLQRRLAIAGLGQYFGEIIVPIEKITEFKGGKRRVVKRKLYPGYLVVQMEINDDTWFLVRETPGIGDFTGAAGHPTPMQPHEVSRIVSKQEEKGDQAPKLKISFNIGDRVKIIEGTFENFEGEVSGIDQTNGQVTVMINIFGRSTPVTLEYWQIEGM